MSKKVKKHTTKEYLAYYVLLPFVLVFIYECLGYRSLTGGFTFLIHQPVAYICNMMILCASFGIALLFRRREGIILSLTLIWTFCAFGNFVLLCNRVTPLTGNDLSLITDLFGVIAKYLNVVQMVLLGLVVVAALAGIVLVFIKAPLACEKVSYPRSVLAMALIAFLTWGSLMVGWNTGTVETQFHELSQSYLKNGFLYCFTNSLLDVGIRKPSDYSPEIIETLTGNDNEDPEEGNEKDPAGADAEKGSEKPNIIIVQLESFFDVKRLKGVAFSEDPIPNFTRLMEEYPSGRFDVPVIGAGTVNSEFEVLTGMNIDDFGAGEYPYKTILKETVCESIAYDLKEEGYSTHAMHNHVGSFYGRNKIYKNLGFDTFTSLEYMYPKAFTMMNWAKDEVLTDEIKKSLDSTDGADFVYVVSVQGHGKYPSGDEAEYEHHVEVSISEDAQETAEDDVHASAAQGVSETTVQGADASEDAGGADSDGTVTKESEEETRFTHEYLNQVSYYANQLYEMDQFVADLVKMLDKSGEDCILFMYGDHLPSLDLADEYLTDGNIYQTEYFIWNNMGLSYDGGEMEAYRTGSRIMESAGMTDGVINAYHQKFGKMAEDGEITEEEYLDGLKKLEYDILYGDRDCYGGELPYEPTEMTMGTLPIRITDVERVSDNAFTVHGEGFTSYSKVYVNEKSCSTWFNENGSLTVTETDLTPGDVIVVWQKKLSNTKPYMYKPELAGIHRQQDTEGFNEWLNDLREN